MQPEGAQDGKVANYPGAAIARTDDDALYQTCRYDLHGYVLDVPNGAYRVTLKFCEPHFGSAGKRVCDVKLQGKTVLAKLDIFAKAGKFAALDHAFGDVSVTDGRLRIEFVYRTSLPCISAIAIERKVFARRINCGGPAQGDYAADFPVSAPAGRARKVPCEDFYADWARTLFGQEAAPDIAAIFARIDSRLPRPLSRGCPAGVRADKRPWKQVAPAYAFVDELARCHANVTGPGNLERFDYWLNTMKYLRAGAKLDCAVGRFHLAMARAKGDKALAARDALPAYRAILAAYREAFQHLLNTVSTNGGLATVMFWQHGFRPVALVQPMESLTKTLGTPLPADSQPSEVYAGPPRLIVPTVRTSIKPGETLTLKVIVLAKKAPRGIALHWRPMGEGRFATVAMSRVARGVHTATFPPGGAKADLEYYVEARADGQVLRFPATAPAINQTLVTLPVPRR
ncbi:hypothetical protein HQ576_15440 [bacterium]|nr:hypothetical protein [bacterium]